MALDRGLGNVLGLVGRVVQDLDFEQVLRVVHLADGIDQPVRDGHLIEDRELNRYTRKGVRKGQRLGARPLFFM